MKLFELFDTQYVVKRVSTNEFTVAKFDGKSAPTAVYTVTQKPGKKFFSDSPGFSKVQQEEKSVQLVKKFIADGEPRGMYYMVDQGQITSSKFLESV